MPTLKLALAVQAVVALWSSCTAGGVLINGDFESTPFDTAWSNTAGDSGDAVVHGGLAVGSTQAAMLRAKGASLGQSFDAVSANWLVEFYLAAADPSLFSGANRAFSVMLNDSATGTGGSYNWQINMRVAAGGDIQSYDGSSWRNVGSGSEISFSVDGNGDGDFSDTADTLNVHRIRIHGRNWGSAAANYDVLVSPANSDVLVEAGVNLSFFQNRPDTVTEQLTAMIFQTSYGMVSGQTYVVDDCKVESMDHIVIEQTDGITVVAEHGATSDSFTVRLKKPLTDTVTIVFSQPGSPQQLLLDPSKLVFSPREGITAKSVTVTAIDDQIEEDDPHFVAIDFEVVSSDSNYSGYPIGALNVAVFDNDFSGQYQSFSGIYPHLAVTNSTRSEAGIGAVAAWAGSLWYTTYSAHKPLGSDDGLYQIHDDYHLTRRPESVGGTPANRMIHSESGQLIIASYLIDSTGRVRTIPLSRMPGRMTATARHLTDPANKVYFVTMEEGLYEVDVNMLAVTTLHQDRNAGGSDLLPGNHGKGGYTGQRRLIVSNNGSGGVLAEWDGSGDPGSPSGWTIIDRNKYTDVTGPGGIYGAPDANAPVWAIGWDHKSVLLNVCDNGGKWKRFRLPKASYTQDADHGWFTEWPRIRRADPNRLLMDMHCMFYEFPKTFSHSNTSGIRPLSTHLKMVVDWEHFQSQMVRACDDASHFGNSILGRAQSNLWFGSMDELCDLGSCEGWGGPWVDETVEAGQPSEPYFIGGFDHRVIHFAAENPHPVDVNIETDTHGNGNWQSHAIVSIPADGYAYHVLSSAATAQWVRFVANESIDAVTTYIHSRCERRVLSPQMFESLPQVGARVGKSTGLIRPASDENMLLHFAADILDPNGVVTERGFYVVGRDMKINTVEDTPAESWLRVNAATTKDFHIDEASVIVTDSSKRRFRLPKGNAAFDEPTGSGWPRGIREVVTERDLMNIHGTIYELPRDASGGLRKIRPITTHNRMIHDFCSWRGMLVLAGNLADAAEDEHYVRSQDGKVGLWFGTVDGLFKLGVPRGKGGPWKNTAVESDQASDPYLMTGYGNKTLGLSHNLSTSVDFIIEVDFLANNTWHKYATFTVGAGHKYTHVFPRGYAAHWVRVKVDKDCTATAQFIYNRLCDGAEDADDLACFSNEWLSQECGICEGADLNSDATVNFADLAILAGNWGSKH